MMQRDKYGELIDFDELDRCLICSRIKLECTCDTPLCDEVVSEISQEYETWLGELEGLAIKAIALKDWEPVLEHIREFQENQEKGTEEDLKHRDARTELDALFDLMFGVQS